VFCLLSNFLLFNTRYVRYLMAFWSMFFMSFLMLVFGMLRSSSFVMDCSCMAPLTPAVMVIRGFVFHPLFFMSLISGSYLEWFCVIAYSGNRSWQYVNLMIWIIFLFDGVKGVVVWLGTPIVHRMSGLSLA
jgi:hypothetical protein